MPSSTSIGSESILTVKHKRFQRVFPPGKVSLDQPPVFLAGSIEMGEAKPWQDAITAKLSNLPITVLNPRRPDFNKEWSQEASFGPFREQVDWEMDQLERCDVIAMYFQPGTRSPITLLELGLQAASGKVIVCCPEGFWRKGNVDIVCSRYGITCVTTEEDLAAETRKVLMQKIEERCQPSTIRKFLLFIQSVLCPNFVLL